MKKRKRATTEGERFEQKFSPEPNSGCWLWTGNIEGCGYGVFCFNRRPVRAHRSSWELHRGPIPAGMHVLHRCDVRSCVNPDHLFLGTHQDNMRDMAAKKRAARGRAIWNSKLDPDRVREIRARLVGGQSIDSIARTYGVRRQSILYIKRGRSWAWIS